MSVNATTNPPLLAQDALLDISPANKAEFDALPNNHVFLAAQLASKDFTSVVSDSIESLFSKNAKFYYGLTVEPGDVQKRMYKKNTNIVKNPRFGTADLTKKLTDPIDATDTDDIQNLMQGVDTLLPLEANAWTVSKEMFETQVNIGATIAGTMGARVVLHAKYKKSDDGNTVTAFGKLLFIKSDKDASSLKLVIRNNIVILGTAVGAGIALEELLKNLFGVSEKFTFEDPSKPTAGQPTVNAAKKDAAGGATYVAPITGASLNSAGGDHVNSVGPLTAATSATSADSDDDIGTNTNSFGGKSTRRKRKNSRKKGSSKKPVSHKKRKSGASKKRRSLPKKK
jgi:hypothetical protein